MAYDAKAVANYFLVLADQQGMQLSSMKLQKLIYYAHGLCLSAYNRPLIDEAIEAWQYGPVVPSIYHEFKEFGSSPIRCRATEAELHEDGSIELRTPSIYDNLNSVENQETKDLLDFTWEAYGKYSAIQLSNLTHEEGTPWAETAKRYPDKRGVDIPDDLMRVWFANRTAATT